MFKWRVFGSTPTIRVTSGAKSESKITPTLIPAEITPTRFRLKRSIAIWRGLRPTIRPSDPDVAAFAEERARDLRIVEAMAKA
jgi:hypothetical protein